MRNPNLPHTHASEREQAVRWLIQNRRPDLSIEQAIRVLSMVLPRDRQSLLLLRRIAEEAAEAAVKTPLNWRTPLGLPPRG
ncbi:hypothetical protein ACI2VH_16725 [Ralstonia nicotianae]|uniref:ANTAR domain-containing protein n=1 Tax=Ralstonia syzygii TaxID=28097 RepID=A0ABX7ZHA3_9RALS|nr:MULTISPECIES: hypothetical protein [Ralstonia]AZU56693.1 hypothetical protein CFM90_11010 [Ralstonia solanacearum]MCK4125652.1 NAD-glutamate dehydrogenase [Ralstonia pseudosolanacearum]MCK4139365.1 NAD-glutamate dehydrogenase [Ralstonia pseudosolanacearum]MDO3518735.1 hypothetical protein [Ralstonia pseudosolanacearum]MDO3544258.1 hypothetical protein [Ralstonia pseudosolanacearum]